VTTPADLLARELSRDGSRPFVTFYDHASGERVELSVATTANWVAKTAGYLIDEHGIDPGDVISVRLPLHWQAVVILLAAWTVGAVVSLDGDGDGDGDGDSVVTFTGPDLPDDSGAAETVALSLAPMGADFSRLVAAHPDVFVPLDATGDDLVDAAASDLPHGARVLSVLRYDGAAALSYGLIAPLDAGGSVVLVTNPDADRLAGLAAAERVTHTLGVDLDGLVRLDR
jgi:uncharacterized protein (TIGR03089 family)